MTLITLLLLLLAEAGDGIPKARTRPALTGDTEGGTVAAENTDNQKVWIAEEEAIVKGERRIVMRVMGVQQISVKNQFLQCIVDQVPVLIPMNIRMKRESVDIQDVDQAATRKKGIDTGGHVHAVHGGDHPTIADVPDQDLP